MRKLASGKAEGCKDSSFDPPHPSPLPDGRGNSRTRLLIQITFYGLHVTPSTFHLIQKRFAKLHDLWRDDVLTIGLEWIVEKVFLMIVLGGVKDGKRRHFCHNLSVPDLCCRDFFDSFLGNSLLGFTVRKDGGTVLGADIIPLAV